MAMCKKLRSDRLCNKKNNRKHSLQRLRVNQSGFSLVELLVSQALLVVALSVFQAAQSNLLISTKQQQSRMYAYWQADDLMARMMLSEYQWSLKRKEIEESHKNNVEGISDESLITALLNTADIKNWDDQFRVLFESHKWNMEYSAKQWRLVVYKNDEVKNKGNNDEAQWVKLFQKELLFER